MEWQPIETAPKGTLVVVTDGRITAPAILDVNGHWYFWEGEVLGDEDGIVWGELNYWLKGHGPTHWMPLPKRPK